MSKEKNIVKIIKGSLECDLLINALLDYKSSVKRKLDDYKVNAINFKDTNELLQVLSNTLAEIKDCDNLLDDLGYDDKLISLDDIPF